MPLKLNESRAASVLREVISSLGSGLLILRGGGQKKEDFIDNQRGVAVLQYIFASENVENVAVYISKEKFVIYSHAAMNAPAQIGDAEKVPVQTVSDADAFVETLRGANVSSFLREIDLQAGDFVSTLTPKVTAAVNDGLKDGNAISSLVLSTKDDDAIGEIKKAGALCGAAFRKLVKPELVKAQKESIKEGAAPLKMIDLASKIDAAMNAPNTMEGLEAMDNTGFGSAGTVIVRSGASYDVSKPVEGEPSADAPMRYDSINISLGAKFSGYKTFMARSYFFDSVTPTEVTKAYGFVVKVFDHVAKSLAPGKVLSTIYNEAIAFAESLDKDLTALLVKDSLGFSTGLRILEQKITAKSSFTVQEDQVYVVRIAVQSDNFQGKGPYSIVFADTFAVTSSGTAPITKMKSSLDEVTLKAVKPKSAIPENYRAPVTRSAAGGPTVSSEELRIEEQRNIIAAKKEAWEASGGKKDVAGKEEVRVTELSRLAHGEARVYDRPHPLLQKEPHVGVDKERQCLWLPVGGKNVPFHIATVQKIELREDTTTKQYCLYVTFFTTQASNAAFEPHRKQQWIKEVQIVAKDDKARLFLTMDEVKTIQQEIKLQDTKRKQTSGVVRQDGLKTSGKRVTLEKVKIRPAPEAKKDSQGDLYAHENGFRFQSAGRTIDILYNNVKHLIFNKAQNDLQVALHLTLKQPIALLAGKKAVQDVQFAVDVLETSELVSAAKRSHDEELDEDEREAQRVQLTNAQFARFAKNVKTELDPSINLEVPFSSFEFYGVWGKQQVKFRGNGNCLWSVTELPFFSLTTDEYEIVALERVMVSGANFDAMFIHKDYKTTVAITNIPMAQLDTLKDWMNQAKLVYFEATSNLSWTGLLKIMREDEEWEPWGPAGWQTYIGGGDEDEEGEEDSDAETDSDYSESDSGSDSDSDYDDSDDSSFESDVSSDDVSTDSGSGDDWDELDRKAQRKDARRNVSDDDSDDDRPKKSRKRGRD